MKIGDINYLYKCDDYLLNILNVNGMLLTLPLQRMGLILKLIVISCIGLQAITVLNN